MRSPDPRPRRAFFTPRLRAAVFALLLAALALITTDNVLTVRSAASRPAEGPSELRPALAPSTTAAAPTARGTRLVMPLPSIAADGAPRGADPAAKSLPEGWDGVVALETK